MLVSVIIPVYNVAPYLHEALDSVIHQTYTKLEIIIIDDGSTDGSGKICDEYAKIDDRIIIIHQENKGLSAARNVGLNMTTGDMIAFLDSDDAYHPDFINLMVSTLAQDKTDISVCRFTSHRTTEEMNSLAHENVYPNMTAGVYNRNRALQAIVEGQINISTWNKLYRRKLWKDIRFPDGHVFEEQQTILEVFFLCNKISVLNASLYRYRRRPGSISDTITPTNMRDLVVAYSYVDRFVVEHLNEIFTLEQAKGVRRLYIKNMIGLYCKCSQKDGNDWAGLCEDIKSLTNEMIQNVKIGDRYSKVFGWMLRYCPGLLKTVYPLYHNIHMCIGQI